MGSRLYHPFMSANDPQRLLERDAKLQWGTPVCRCGVGHVSARAISGSSNRAGWWIGLGAGSLPGALPPGAKPIAPGPAYAMTAVARVGELCFAAPVFLHSPRWCLQR